MMVLKDFDTEDLLVELGRRAGKGDPEAQSVVYAFEHYYATGELAVIEKASVRFTLSLLHGG